MSPWDWENFKKNYMATQCRLTLLTPAPGSDILPPVHTGLEFMIAMPDPRLRQEGSQSTRRGLANSFVAGMYLLPTSRLGSKSLPAPLRQVDTHCSYQGLEALASNDTGTERHDDTPISSATGTSPKGMAARHQKEDMLR